VVLISDLYDPGGFDEALDLHNFTLRHYLGAEPVDGARAATDMVAELKAGGPAGAMSLPPSEGEVATL